MQYYFKFWNKIHQIVNHSNQNKQGIHKHPFYLNNPLPINYNKRIAYNFLIHHCGIHYKIVQYLLNRRLILSGYTKNNIPIIAFIQRRPANKKIAKHLTIPNLKYHNTLRHDIDLAKQNIPKQGTQDEEPIGVDYLFLIPTHYKYRTSDNKEHYLLEINLLRGYKGFAEYRVMKGNSFNIRLGRYPNKIIFTTNPIESICYFQLHLKQHRKQQNTLIVSLLQSNPDINQIISKNYLINNKLQIVFAPNHQLSSQSIINNYIKYNQDYSTNIKVVYPTKYRTWMQMLQQSTFNNQHNFFINNILSPNQNIHLINTALVKYIGEYGTQCFSLMLHVLAKSYQQKIHHNYEPLNATNIRIQSYMVIKNKVPHQYLHFISQYMDNVGYYYSPIQVDMWFQQAYNHIFHKRNSMLHTQTFKYIDTFQYHTSTDMIKSLRKQGKQMLNASILGENHINHQHYKDRQDNIMHIKRNKSKYYPHTHNTYSLQYKHNHNLYENR